MSKRRAVSNAPPRDRAALVSLVTRQSRAAVAGADDPDTLLEELTGLARAAGAEVVLAISQARITPDPATLIGAGKTVYEWKSGHTVVVRFPNGGGYRVLQRG